MSYVLMIEFMTTQFWVEDLIVSLVLGVVSGKKLNIDGVFKKLFFKLSLVEMSHGKTEKCMKFCFSAKSIVLVVVIQRGLVINILTYYY